MKKQPTLQNAIHHVRDDSDARMAVVFAAVFAWTLGFVVGFVLGEREAAASRREGSDGDA